jgi:hypothetical protein
MNHSIVTTQNKVKSFFYFIVIAGIACILSSPVMAADAAKGKILHDAKCFGCHDTHQYTRKNRIIHTFEDLQGRVEFCDAASKAGFSPEDIEDVVAYLNKEFYKFKQ